MLAGVPLFTVTCSGSHIHPFTYLREHFRGDVVGRADGGVGELPTVFLPRLCLSLRIHRVGQIERLHLTEVSVELGSVRLFQTRAKPKVGQLNMAVGV